MKHDHRVILHFTDRFKISEKSPFYKRAEHLMTSKDLTFKSTLKKSHQKINESEMEGSSSETRIKLLSQILANAYFSFCHKETGRRKWIIYTRSNNDSRTYWMKPIIETLKEEGYIKHKLGEQGKNTGTSSSFRAKRKLIELINNKEGLEIKSPIYFFPDITKESIQEEHPEDQIEEYTATFPSIMLQGMHEVRNENKQPIRSSYTEDDLKRLTTRTPEHKIAQFINDLNKYRRRTVFTYDGARYQGIKSKRIFNQSLGGGGRIYNQMQNFKNKLEGGRELRSEMLIDNKPAVEIDYAAMHPSLIYSQNDIQIEEDPYKIDGIPRDICKYLFQLLINCKSVLGAKQTATKSLKKDYKSPAPDKVIQYYEANRKVSTGSDIETILKHHQIIAHEFDKDQAGSLLYLDSEIMISNMKKLIAQDIPFLDVHDSIVAPKENEETLKNIMISSYKEIMGKKPLFKEES